MSLFNAGTRRGSSPVVSDRVWTAPNVVTFVRLLGLPLFVWLTLGPGAHGIAFGVLALVATSDWVDGYLARRLNQVTRLGQLMDPVIDRILLATTAVTLVIIGFIPLWITIAVVTRDVLLLAGALLLTRGVPRVPVSRLGKFATANLLVGVPWFMLGNMRWPLNEPFLFAAWCFTLVGLVTYWAAGLDYGRQVLRARRSR